MISKILIERLVDMCVNTENKPREILENILKQYGAEGIGQIGLGYKYKLHIDLSEKYPYIEDDTLDEDYVKECTDKAIEVYKTMKFSSNLLVVYDDMLSEHSLEEKKFLENNLENIEGYDKYNYKWQYPDDDGELIRKRYVYKVEKVNIKRLFKEIILSDIGGKLDLVSSIYIIDMDRKHIFYLYDDRGLFIYALEEKYLPGI